MTQPWALQHASSANQPSAALNLPKPPSSPFPLTRPQGFQDGWANWGYSASFSDQAKSGASGGTASCGTIQQYGAWQAGQAAAGKAAGKSTLQLWVDNGAGLSINIASQKVRGRGARHSAAPAWHLAAAARLRPSLCTPQQQHPAG